MDYNKIIVLKFFLALLMVLISLISFQVVVDKNYMIIFAILSIIGGILLIKSMFEIIG